MARATAGSIIVDLMLKTGMFETDADRAERRLRKLASEIENISKKNNQANRNNGGGNGSSNSGSPLDAVGLGGLGRNVGIAAAIGTIARLSDEATKLRGILQASSSENIKYSQSLNDVTRIANLSQAGLEGVGVAYGRIAMATADLGLKQNEVSNIVETVSLALKVNGATAAETTSTLIQLSQAFGKGKLDGDEFRTVMEAAPPVMRKLAESLGVPFGALKDLAAQGRITTEVLTKAWNNPQYLSQLRRQAEGMQTISGSVTVARNSLVSLVSSIDDVIPASKLASSVISGFSNTVQFLSDTISQKPLDWKKFFNTSNIPVGMQVKVDPSTGQIIAGTIDQVRDWFNKATQATVQKNPNVVLGKNDTIADVGVQLKKQSENLQGFINDKTFKTAKEKLQTEVNDLYKAFTGAVEGIPQGAPAYEDAFAVFRARYLELVNGSPKKEKAKKQKKTDEEKEQEEIQKFIDSLSKQIATMGKTEIEVTRYESTLLNMNETQRAATEALLATQEALAKDIELKERAKSLTEEFLDPQLQFNKSYTELNTLLANGMISLQVYNTALKDLLNTYNEANPEVEKFKKEQDELNKILEQTPTAQLEKTRELIKRIYDEFEGRFNDPKFQESIDVILGRTTDSAKKSSDLIETFYKRAAENAQDALADFLFDPAKDGFDGMVLDFANALRRMAANALAAQIFKSIFGEKGDSGGFGWGKIAEGFGGLFGGSSGSSGTPATSSSSGGGGASSWIGLIGKGIQSWFGGAFADGGRPPMGKISLVGENGPELFVPDGAGTVIPNDGFTFNNASSSEVNVKNINVLDPSLVGQFLNTDAGERIILNVIQRNRSAMSGG